MKIEKIEKIENEKIRDLLQKIKSPEVARCGSQV
jgi:hypothetical protein